MKELNIGRMMTDNGKSQVLADNSTPVPLGPS
jgi:hypothetical protein